MQMGADQGPPRGGIFLQQSGPVLLISDWVVDHVGRDDPRGVAEVLHTADVLHVRHARDASVKPASPVEFLLGVDHHRQHRTAGFRNLDEALFSWWTDRSRWIERVVRCVGGHCFWMYHF